MTNPDRAYEKKVLLDVVKQMEDPELTGRKQATLKRAIVGVGWIILFGGFFLGLNDLAHSVVVTFVAGIGGAAVGFGLYLDFAQKQWPVTVKHINMESVRNRINELEI